MESISVQALGHYLASGDESVQLVDVREVEELEIVAIPGFINLPLSQFQAWQPQISDLLNPDQEVWVLCHHGVRSAQFCYWLQQQGYGHVKNISGGIDAFVRQVNQNLPLY